ncbi:MULTISPECIES: helix-turn-helix domain-containing protein [unclassified Cellulophaga]|uniref:helix-turn-helix domain-containing protein n=1 Tax=unclassified Cellulophaga TaxID=2634405 RepID=UPI0026E37507|nr:MULTISPECIES: AraC family transcriptional regulator [unclassified Cellulophaga]MDO6491706.1 AraC family transcriptional regulator [Cellulophaga sp. 2_MG-2023]MDO6495639.1 AraC family transcriptional regulator [Cellulophaga sp. 3_MG-2023]
MFSIQFKEAKKITENYNVPLYSILLLEEDSHFSVNFVEYITKEKSILFLSPYQTLKWHNTTSSKVKLLQFHGDFYCIEFQKDEVACNGLLFNNVYLQPYITLDKVVFDEISELLTKMEKEVKVNKRFSSSVLKSYLQLILAICSNEKDHQLGSTPSLKSNNNDLFMLQEMLELHFREERNPSFYANKLTMSPSSFSKKVKYRFKKTPTQLIQERVILEAKKLLHLTHKTVKEVALELNFDDEFYFSRYFKKEVGLSPTHFREEVGISIVAK